MATLAGLKCLVRSFAVVGAAFRVANDHISCAGILQHLCADIASVSALDGDVAVLSATRHTGRFENI